MVHVAGLRSGLPEQNTTRPHTLNIFTPVLPRGHDYNPATIGPLMSAAA